MPYRFNAFTDKLDLVETAMTSGGIVSLTGNDAVVVGPDGSGNVNVVGAGAVRVTGNSGTNTETISVTGSGIVWQTITASQALVSNNGYICVAAGGALALSLPATSSLGDIIEITLDGATSFAITQAPGQQIRYGNTSTTSGAGGSITTIAQGDTIRMVCQTANLKWNIISSLGNLTVV